MAPNMPVALDKMLGIMYLLLGLCVRDPGAPLDALSQPLALLTFIDPCTANKISYMGNNAICFRFRFAVSDI